MPLGLYISVPFCRSKCSYCNFASDVFSRALHQRYVDRVCADIEHARRAVEQIGGQFESPVNSIFLGGGTPTVLDINELERLFVTIRSTFRIDPAAEITVECAPGTISDGTLDMFIRCEVNRVSLGVQSFVDGESAAVGRLHTHETVSNDLCHLRAAGISNINLDLIAGLPHQTAESWRYSLERVTASGVPHASVYMLEVDEDSRLGRELIAGGKKYHAHFVPDEDLVAGFYEEACERLNGAGINQYEISNFAREGFQSWHNLKYWTRQPYLGFGVDAHSMLLMAGEKKGTALRFSTPDSLDEYLGNSTMKTVPVSSEAALEETFFLGLRLNSGVDLQEVKKYLGVTAVAEVASVIADCVRDGLISQQDDTIRLTARGRLLSNEVFQRFISIVA